MVRVYKAQSNGYDSIPNRVLSIEEPLPDVFKMYPGVNGKELIQKASEFFDQQAAIIEEALSGLPGGTQHALLIRLLKRKENVLHVLDR